MTCYEEIASLHMDRTYLPTTVVGYDKTRTGNTNETNFENILLTGKLLTTIFAGPAFPVETLSNVVTPVVACLVLCLQGSKRG